MEQVSHITINLSHIYLFTVVTASMVVVMIIVKAKQEGGIKLQDINDHHIVV